MRKVRSAHGTRVAHSVVCQSCGETDTIHFAPKDAASAYCRKCAAEILGAIDDDAGIQHEVECTECGQRTTNDLPPIAGEEYLCADCRAGIITTQENKTSQSERVSDKVVRVRRKRDE